MDQILMVTWLKYHAYPNIRWTPSQSSIFRKLTCAEHIQLQGDRPIFLIINLPKILILHLGKYGIWRSEVKVPCSSHQNNKSLKVSVQEMSDEEMPVFSIT